MATGPGSSDAENGVKMAGRDRFRASPATAFAAGVPQPRDAGTQARPDNAAADPGAVQPQDTARAAQPEEAAAGVSGNDTGPGAQAEQQAGDDGGLEVYGDSAYGSGEARAAYRQGGHDTFIKPGPLRPAVPGGFTVDDFAVDEEQGTVTCPDGVTRQMSPARAVTFGAACAACPLRDLCTTARDGRSMTIHPHEGLLRAARAHARTPEFKQAYPTRSNIERTIAWIATQNGRRIKLRYIGTVKTDAWLHTRCAGLNLRTLVRAGLTRRGGVWALA